MARSAFTKSRRDNTATWRSDLSLLNSLNSWRHKPRERCHVSYHRRSVRGGATAAARRHVRSAQAPFRRSSPLGPRDRRWSARDRPVRRCLRPPFHFDRHCPLPSRVSALAPLLASPPTLFHFLLPLPRCLPPP